MLTRRKILVFGSLMGLSSWLQAKSRASIDRKVNTKVKRTIAAVQEHLFPSNSKIPSAKMMHANTFLLETISHKSYDKDIRRFVLEGAKELEVREKGLFTTLSKEDKERALREYEETNYGSSWLSRIMTLTMEGIFSDPIYGSNKNEKGWQAIKSFGGQPRPNTRYLDV
ncbi:MAG: Unknown protein [uncultured Sulfurovum sp.]|uniref:Gluconate 2-dehydrogenase subunit 3 family protein n=1 Tax=uncultured Sulfurovum sp. TaxID=269237 RepID=A0A6S6T582_9BACT|nr:MAG: Unknown protein [uncultured Sulfurovum sp.]